MSVLTTGTHDRVYMKQFKNFPKTLLNLPWKIDYRIKVPATTDLEVNAGHGAVKISGVEGAMRISATERDSSFTLTGGVVSATIAVGSVTLSIPTRSWRGGGADIRVAAGALNVEIPPGFSGDIDADVLRVGQIVNGYDGLEAREKPGITERSIRARAGAGGPFFKFTIGDATGYISVDFSGVNLQQVKARDYETYMKSHKEKSGEETNDTTGVKEEIK